MQRDKSPGATVPELFLFALIVGLMLLPPVVGCSKAGKGDGVVGRWDITIQSPRRAYPSWVEIKEDDGQLSGRFVGRSGSARPIKTISYTDGELHFALPTQYESRESDLVFKGRLKDGKLVGETDDGRGNSLEFSAVRSPELPAVKEIVWGEPIELIRKDLSNWTSLGQGGTEGWTIENGVLSNTPPTVNLITREKYTDFKLHVEFRVPPKGNSGVYLRGRYEVQVVDDFDREPHNRSTGSIYGFLAPDRKAGKPAGEWNSFDITLNGRWVTVEFNGQKVIDNAEIPGITGGAIDSNEGEPGPILVQGDHQKVEYRNIILTPAR